MFFPDVLQTDIVWQISSHRNSILHKYLDWKKTWANTSLGENQFKSNKIFLKHLTTFYTQTNSTTTTKRYTHNTKYIICLPSFSLIVSPD